MKNIDNVSMKVLSMGMTGDYAVAVSEGATYVRVGLYLWRTELRSFCVRESGIYHGAVVRKGNEYGE